MNDQIKSSNTEIKKSISEFSSIFDASRELSDEIYTEKLILKFLNLCANFSDLTKAILLINKEDSLNIRALKNEIINEPILVDSIPYVNSKDLSHKIIESVVRRTPTGP